MSDDERPREDHPGGDRFGWRARRGLAGACLGLIAVLLAPPGHAAADWWPTAPDCLAPPGIQALRVNPVGLATRDSLTVTQPGAVIQNLDIARGIDITANNVTIRNVRVRTNGGPAWGINIHPGVTGVTRDGIVSSYPLYINNGTSAIGNVFDGQYEQRIAAPTFADYAQWALNFWMDGRLAAQP